MFEKITMIDYTRSHVERAKARKTVGPYTWHPSSPNTGRAFYQASNRLEMDPRGSTFALRLEEANDHLPYGSRLKHTTGYFCDEYGDGDTMSPIIARLPHGRGYLAGWTMGNGMLATLTPTIYKDIEDAAYAAHSEAEHDAASEREHQEELEDDE